MQPDEQVDMSRLGACPSVAEWPPAANITCDRQNCRKKCVAVELTHGNMLAQYVCPDEHLTPILAHRNGEEWVFEPSPF